MYCSPCGLPRGQDFVRSLRVLAISQRVLDLDESGEIAGGSFEEGFWPGHFVSTVSISGLAGKFSLPLELLGS